MIEKKDKTEPTGIGKRIREWRKGKNLRAYQLAKIIKVSQGSLSDIENGKSAPSAQTIVSLLTLTEIDWRWVLTGKRGEVKVGELPLPENVLIVHVSPGSEILIKGRES